MKRRRPSFRRWLGVRQQPLHDVAHANQPLRLDRTGGGEVADPSVVDRVGPARTYDAVDAKLDEQVPQMERIQAIRVVQHDGWWHRYRPCAISESVSSRRSSRAARTGC